MTVYNTKVEWLKEAIDSILQQTYKNFELVIVNDGSINEETNKTLIDYALQNSIINLITFTNNIGRPYALNEGLKNCQNDLIFIFDSDDIAYENAIQSQVDFFLNLEKNPDNKIGAVGCQLISFDATTYEKKSNELKSKSIKAIINKNDLLKSDDRIAHACCMFRKSIILSELGGYPTAENEQPEDFFLFMNLLEKDYNLYNNPDVLFLYRRHNIGLGSKLNNKNYENMRKKVYSIIKDLEISKNKIENLNLKSHLISDATIVSACFYLKDYYPEKSQLFARNVSEMVNENGEFLLEKLCYMTIFCDNHTYPEIFKIRNEKYNLGKFTKYYVMNFEDIWTYQWKDKVIENREKHWPTRDTRAEWPSHLITCNKADFILTAINENFFNTSNFVWCDFNIKKIFNDQRVKEYYDKKYSLKERDTIFLNILSNIPKKFHVQIINVIDKKYLLNQNKLEFYNHYRYKIAGTLFSLSNIPDNIKILEELKQNFINMVELGFGHGEEMLFYDVYYKNFNNFERSYGDYSEVIYNFCYPTENLNYVLNSIVKNYLNLKYYEECLEACEKVLYSFYNKKIEMNWNLFLNFLFYKYVSSFYCDKDLSIKTALEILYYVDNVQDFKIEFNKSREFYLQQLSFVL